MAKIIYKEGCEGQNNLSSIEGIEIELLNGQKALIYPKYAEMPLLEDEQTSEWRAANESEIEALKVEDTNGKTKALLKIGCPAAEWVSQFKSDNRGVFCLPSLLSALETQYQKWEIDALAKTIEGADLLIASNYSIVSCSRSGVDYCWYANGGSCLANSNHLYYFYLVVPTILYK